MSIFDTLQQLDQDRPMNDTYDMDQTYEPTYVEPSEQAFGNWQDEFAGFKSRPVLYNVDGYISPYATNNWGGTSSIMKTLGDESRLPPLSDKIDPNKIFTSEIAAFRALAADQQKIVKMFEKKLMEGLTERGKFGLNETDIEAMSALTAARGAISNINKEQVAIKKNIADLRIKQNAAVSNAGGTSADGSETVHSGSAMDVGRSILDSLFDAKPIPQNTPAIPEGSYETASVADAAKVIDGIVSDGEVAASIQYESEKPTTYVIVGETDDDVEFATYSSDGELIVDYPNPNTKITNIDREAKSANDELFQSYPLKFKNEIETDGG